MRTPEIEVLWTRAGRACCTVRDHEFHERLSEQVQPCVFAPGPELRETVCEWYEDDPFVEVDPDSVRIVNVERAHEGLDDLWVGYDFQVDFRLREREGLVF